MADTRGNAYLEEQGHESFVLDATDYDQKQAKTARGEAWQAADEARARANDLLAQADEARAEANRLEAQAIADDAGVDYEEVDPNASTWEAAVSENASAGDEE